MSLKLVLSAAVIVLVLSCIAEARHVSHHTQYIEGRSNTNEGVSVAGRHPHPASRHGLQKQARVFPGAVAIKKLVLLKFKKVVPISLILLKASDENEAELVPVYPNSEIPADVQFIPTPNGISGHKDVQAIAIPTQLHQQLEASGLANLHSIEALLNNTEEENTVADNAVVAAAAPEDELLNVKDDDEDQLLEGVSAVQPLKSTPTNMGLRRFAPEDLHRPSAGLRATQHTTVEEIPLFLYSAKDTPQFIYPGHKTGTGRRHSVVSGRRHHA